MKYKKTVWLDEEFIGRVTGEERSVGMTRREERSGGMTGGERSGGMSRERDFGGMYDIIVLPLLTEGGHGILLRLWSVSGLSG